MLLAVAASPAIARGLDEQDVARLRGVRQVAIAPDGELVAYLLLVPRTPGEGEDGPASVELHLVDREGLSRPFVTGSVRLRDIHWRPDGKAVSFLAKRAGDEHTSVYLIPVDGGEARRLIAHGSGVSDHCWRRDGRSVVFLAREPEDKARKQARDKGFTEEVFEERERPVRLWTAELDEGGVAGKPKMLGFLKGSGFALECSPADTLVAVAMAPTPRIDDQYMRAKLHMVHVRRERVMAVKDPAAKLGPFRFSPDGARIAIVAGADARDPQAGRLMVGPVKAPQLFEVLPQLEGHVRSVAWRDPMTVAYVADVGTESIYGEARADGSGDKIFLGPGTALLGGLSLSRNGKWVAAAGHGSDHPPEVYLLRPRDRHAKRLTDSNPWLEERKLGRQETVRHKAGDDLDLEGLLIRPLPGTSEAPHPLIVMVHGGPEWHFENGWLTHYIYPGQVAAARGFAVFYPNYRGSTGRGVDFTKKGQGDPAGKEFSDILDAVDHLVERGIADKARVGITGGSYGGYASAWAATAQSKRFAASVVFAGISNQTSKIGTTDIPNEMLEVHYIKAPWENWELFLKRSPIFHAGASVTPTLVVHGTRDTRVHPSQAHELYRHLKLRGKAPVRLIYYPGEPHGLRRAASRFDYNRRLMRWMEHFVRDKEDGLPPVDFPARSARKKK